MLLNINEYSQIKSFRLLPFFGYFILLLVIIDYLILLYPLQLLNPYWEFEIMGNIVETFLAPLFAFILIFIPRDISIFEQRILKWLLRFIFVMGIVFVLLLPLLFFNVQRINTNNFTSFNTQRSQQNQQFNQLEKGVEKASKEQLQVLLRQSIPPNEKMPEITSQKDLEIYFLTILTNNQRNAEKITKDAFDKTSLELKKTAFKRGVGLIICSVMLFFLSQYGQWINQLYKN